MLPELLPVVGDDYDQSVIQRSELLQFGDKLLQARIVVQNLTVVAVDGPADEPVRVDPGLFGAGTVDHCSAGVLDFSA